MIGRRGFITGLVSLVAAPAIVRAGSLMPVKSEFVRRPGMRFIGTVDTSDGWSSGMLYKSGDIVYLVQFRDQTIRYQAIA